MTDGELVRAVAERVMGWPVSCQQPDGFWWVNPTPDDVPIGYGVLHPFDPLQWDGDACMVLDRMVELEFSMGLLYHARTQRWLAEFHHPEKHWTPGTYEANEPTRCRAVCVAALKAVSGE